LSNRSLLGALAALLLVNFIPARAQQPAEPGSTAQPASAPLTFPPTSGPLTLPQPRSFTLGPLGHWYLGGLGTLMAAGQNHADIGDATTRVEFSNAFGILQKPEGWLQFYVQAGAYNLPAVGTPLYSTATAVSRLYGPVPAAYVEVAPSHALNIQAGKLLTLLGGESTFTFQNYNVDRGLLWNQTNAVNRGVQVNYTHRALTTSLSWNDGFYSDRWNWLTGLASYAVDSSDTLSVTAGGNIGRTGYSTFATPAFQNNSSIYDIIYARKAGPWSFQPYVQYTRIAQLTSIGADRTTYTLGAAMLLSRTFGQNWSMAARGEIIHNSGKRSGASLNLLYGPGSSAGSITLTPAYQRKHEYARGEFSWVGARSITTGDGFGPFGGNSSQVRGLIEAGIMF
jgi:hypothetical protein